MWKQLPGNPRRSHDIINLRPKFSQACGKSLIHVEFTLIFRTPKTHPHFLGPLKTVCASRRETLPTAASAFSPFSQIFRLGSKLLIHVNTLTSVNHPTVTPHIRGRAEETLLKFELVIFFFLSKYCIQYWSKSLAPLGNVPKLKA